MPALKIGLLLFPGCMPAGLFAAADLFQAANRRGGKPVFALQWLGLKRGSVKCAHGMALQAEAALADADCDAVLIPGLWAESVEQLQAWLAANAALVQALHGLPRRVQLWSYCTGVALAAETGRLVREPATATWWMADWLSQRHPRVDWQWQRASTAGARSATASGVHGYLPIVCDQVERRLSADLWREIARLTVLPRPQPAASVFQSLALIRSSDPWLRRLRLVLEACPAAEASVERLAAELATSPRTLARRVKALTGQPAGRYARLVKLNQVGEQLLHTGDTVARIGESLGFADESSLRRMFRQVTGMTPGDYRQAYRP